MSNAAGAKASREEEIAFLVMEQVLGVDIKLADAGAGDKMPDGSWVYPGAQERQGIVEITSPPATSLMSEWARAKKEGRSQTEGGSIPVRWNELAQVCTEMLEEGWASENVDDLVLPHGISDIWFRGRAKRDLGRPLGTTELWVARFQAGSGWHRYVARIEEQHLPSPNPGIADDRVPAGWRLPKDRTVHPACGG